MSDTSKNPSVSSIARLAAHNVAKIREVFHDQPAWRFVTGVAEEAGEFVGAFNKWSGTSRQTGTQDEMAKELADVILTAYMAAEVLGINLDEWVQRKAAIMNERGWKTRDTVQCEDMQPCSNCEHKHCEWCTDCSPASEPAVADGRDVHKGTNFFVQQTTVPERPVYMTEFLEEQVSLWRAHHEGSSEFSLPAFLGMTPDEYGDWVTCNRITTRVANLWLTAYLDRVGMGHR